MPELPEVQTVVNQIKSDLLRNKVESITPIWPKVLHNFTSEKAKQKIKDGEILDVSRRAKFIIIKFAESIIAIHLRMTGKLYLLPENQTISKYATAYFTLKNKRKLIFDDVRKFGRIYLYKNIKPIDERHGPEPLESNFTSESLFRLIKSKKRNIKALLLDQSMIAGLGNIYADESLWKSKIHPNSLSHKIPKKRIEDLYKNISLFRRKIKEAIKMSKETHLYEVEFCYLEHERIMRDRAREANSRFIKSSRQNRPGHKMSRKQKSASL